MMMLFLLLYKLTIHLHWRWAHQRLGIFGRHSALQVIIALHTVNACVSGSAVLCWLDPLLSVLDARLQLARSARLLQIQLQLRLRLRQPASPSPSSAAAAAVGRVDEWPVLAVQPCHVTIMSSVKKWRCEHFGNLVLAETRHNTVCFYHVSGLQMRFISIVVSWHLATVTGHHVTTARVTVPGRTSAMRTSKQAALCVLLVRLSVPYRVPTGPWKSLKKVSIFPVPGKSLKTE